MRWSSSGLPRTGTGAGALIASTWPPAIGLTSASAASPISARSHGTSHAQRGRRRRGPAAAGRRPGAASAARSAAPSRPSRRSSPSLEVGSSRAWSSSRLARMLVRGVRSSCEASATNSRCALHHLLRLASGRRRARRSIWSRCGPARRPRRRCSGCGDRAARGRGSSAISRAVAVSAAIGRIARLGDREAGECREQGAAETPATRKSQSRLMVSSTDSSARAYWTYVRDPKPRDPLPVATSKAPTRLIPGVAGPEIVRRTRWLHDDLAVWQLRIDAEEEPAEAPCCVELDLLARVSVCDVGDVATCWLSTWPRSRRPRVGSRRGSGSSPAGRR